MNDIEKMRVILEETPAANTSYNDWLRIGMACKGVGLTADDWDAWSRNDCRYKAGDCAKRWKGFRGGVGIGTAVYIAKNYGFVPPHDWAGSTTAPIAIKGNATDDYIEKVRAWAAVLPANDCMISESEFKAILADDTKETAKADFIQYITALFEPSDFVGVSHNLEYSKDAEFIMDGDEVRVRYETAETLKRFCEQESDGEELDATDWEGTFGYKIHRYLPASTIINPLYKRGKYWDCAAENVASYRHILIESDDMPLYEQLKILLATGAPISTITYSGNKSLHACVRVEAKDAVEYRERFELVQDVCAAYGMRIDPACKNPNRWTRTAGAKRRGRIRQNLIAANVGARSWDDWKAEITAAVERAELNKDYKRFGVSPVSFGELMDNPPEPVPHIIENALKLGREGILTASSKAGKSWLMLELAIAAADGGTWLGYKVNPCRVALLNMELGADDMHERAMLIQNALGELQHPENISVLNCMGVCSDLEKMQSMVERWVIDTKSELLILDPVYSLMGNLEENSNGDVMQFLERLAQIRKHTGCATFMTHHMSKGTQDGKAAIDMGSGAGAFARHPDMLLSLQTATPENLRGFEEGEVETYRRTGAEFFVFNETLRSFPSRRRDEIWLAQYPVYSLVNGAGYDRMGAFHKQQVSAAECKWRDAIRACIEDGDEPNAATVARKIGVDPAAARKWKSRNADKWDAFGGA